VLTRPERREPARLGGHGHRVDHLATRACPTPVACRPSRIREPCL
jgi:hypothetical protein